MEAGARSFARFLERSGKGKVDLYRGKEVVRRNIHFDSGRGELIQLIKEAGMWKDPNPRA